MNACIESIPHFESLVHGCVGVAAALSLSFSRAGLVMAATTFSAFPALFELFPLVSPMAAPIAAQPVMHPALFSRTLEFQLFLLPFFLSWPAW